jgi:cyanophycinase
MMTALAYGFRRWLTTIVAVVLLVVPAGRSVEAQNAWWPRTGSVILGGGGLTPATFADVARRLIALAGGADSLIVIIPTANEAVAPRIRGTGPSFDPNELKAVLQAAGARHVAIVHTRDRAVADGEDLASVIRSASGIWIPGGGARILEKTYRGTRVARELAAVLARGGVIFGDSAGAIALGCFALGWTPDPWGVLVDGLSILPRVTVVPHASAARGYMPANETLTYLVAHPGPTGLVIDENTALVITAGTAQVIGSGTVAFVDPARNPRKAYRVLKAGAPVRVAE